MTPEKTLEEAIEQAKTLNAMMGHKPGDPHGWTVVRRLKCGVLVQFYPEPSTEVSREPAGYCIRASGHDGPCNGLPRNDCFGRIPEAKP